MTTAKNRIALRGGLDFASHRFSDVTVAVVDAKGCAMVRQAIRGSFERPEIEKPQVLTSLAGPVVDIYRKARGLFPERPCEAFYAGSVPPPK
jgi:AsmA protein